MTFNDEQRKNLYENFVGASEVEVIEYEGELLVYDPDCIEEGSWEL
jgi:hypothetical protein